MYPPINYNTLLQQIFAEVCKLFPDAPMTIQTNKTKNKHSPRSTNFMMKLKSHTKTKFRKKQHVHDMILMVNTEQSKNRAKTEVLFKI
jgi:hypothetical protein